MEEQTHLETSLLHLGGPRFCDALKKRALPDGFLLRLATPQSIFRFSIPLRMDSGELKMLWAWRIRFSDVLGPTKGGVRFYPATDERNLIPLAFRLVLKSAANRLPHGGAAGGIDVDPRSLSPMELRRLAHGYVEALADRIGPDFDILSPDLGTDARVMGWMAESYCRLRSLSTAGAINGKPLALGGIPGRPGATARGALCVLNSVLADSSQTVQGMTCAVQGYGNAGGHLARLLQDQGANIVAVSDRSAGLYKASGLDTNALWKHKQSGKHFESFKETGVTHTAPNDVLFAPADLLIPAGVANQITLDHATKLNCRFILEIANGPVSSDAEPILAERKIEVIPDLIANAGGITMSHFEWSQNRSGLLWCQSEASSKLEEKMYASASNLIYTAHDHGVSLAVGAQMLAIDRLLSAFSL